MNSCNIDYKKTITVKNQILTIIFGISVLLRCVVNSAFISFSSILAFATLGLTITGILALASWKIRNPYIVMYATGYINVH